MGYFEVEIAIDIPGGEPIIITSQRCFDVHRSSISGNILINLNGLNVNKFSIKSTMRS